MNTMARCAATATAAINKACDELRDITSTLNTRDRARRQQALRDMHPLAVAELLNDIASACGPSMRRNLEQITGNADSGMTWCAAMLSDAADEVRDAHKSIVDKLRESEMESRWHDDVRIPSRTADECIEAVERIDENMKWGE